MINKDGNIQTVSKFESKLPTVFSMLLVDSQFHIFLFVVAAADDGVQLGGANTASKMCSEKETKDSIDSNEDLAHICGCIHCSDENDKLTSEGMLGAEVG